jgi:hypothetical protein
MGMTDKKINQVLDLYEQRVSSFNKTRLLLMTDNLDPNQQISALDGIERVSTQLKHINEMIGKMRVFLTEGRREKAFRWLGFIQGVFYSLGLYTIDDMADHNRPTKGDLQEQYPGHSFDVYGCAECSKDSGTQTRCVHTEEFRNAPLDKPTAN